MSSRKNVDRVCILVIVLSLIVTVLFMNGEKLGIETVRDTDAEGYAGEEYFTANDLDGDWDTAAAAVITLCGDSAKISGNGAYWLDGSLVIAQSGQYVISGELTDGNIIVNAAKYSKVWILLDGVNVACGDDACIRIDQADKVFLTLAGGSENTLSGGETFSESALADGTDAVLFSHDDLTINGSGSLNILSSYLNGITSKDDLIITGGTINISAPNHGIRVNDRFRMTSAVLTVSAEQDGIHCEGDIVIRDGELTITAGDDAIHSDTSVLILGGTLQVNDCYEGIEAVTIEISGGDTTIRSRDDGLNANGYTGTAFGDGMGMMSPMYGISQGFPADGFMFSEEDGTLEEDGSASDQETAVVSAEDTWILISGGRLTLLNESGADADGLDSNGNITVTGGEILISLTGSNGNSALDCGSESGGTAAISGGTIVACGDSSMAEGFGTESAQASILYLLSESAEAGSTVVLLDDLGNELMSAAIPFSFSAVLVSCPEMTVGGTYTIRIGETEAAVGVTAVSETAGEASAFGMMPGTAMPGGEEMPPGGFGEAPPELPDGEEGFRPPEGESGMPENMEAGSTPPAPPDFTGGQDQDSGDP